MNAKQLEKESDDPIFSGGFSRYFTPSRCGVTQSPVSSMVLEMDAWVASTSSINEGGLMMQAIKMSDAINRTTNS